MHHQESSASLIAVAENSAWFRVTVPRISDKDSLEWEPVIATWIVTTQQHGDVAASGSADVNTIRRNLCMKPADSPVAALSDEEKRQLPLDAFNDLARTKVHDDDSFTEFMLQVIGLQPNRPYAINIEVVACCVSDSAERGNTRRIVVPTTDFCTLQQPVVLRVVWRQCKCAGIYVSRQFPQRNESEEGAVPNFTMTAIQRNERPREQWLLDPVDTSPFAPPWRAQVEVYDAVTRQLVATVTGEARQRHLMLPDLYVAHPFTVRMRAIYDNITPIPHGSSSSSSATALGSSSSNKNNNNTDGGVFTSWYGPWSTFGLFRTRAPFIVRAVKTDVRYAHLTVPDIANERYERVPPHSVLDTLPDLHPSFGKAQWLPCVGSVPKPKVTLTGRIAGQQLAENDAAAEHMFRFDNDAQLDEPTAILGLQPDTEYSATARITCELPPFAPETTDESQVHFRTRPKIFGGDGGDRFGDPLHHHATGLMGDDEDGGMNSPGGSPKKKQTTTVPLEATAMDVETAMSLLATETSVKIGWTLKSRTFEEEMKTVSAYEPRFYLVRFAYLRHGAYRLTDEDRDTILGPATDVASSADWVSIISNTGRAVKHALSSVVWKGPPRAVRDQQEQEDADDEAAAAPQDDDNNNAVQLIQDAIVFSADRTVLLDELEPDRRICVHVRAVDMNPLYLLSVWRPGATFEDIVVNAPEEFGQLVLPSVNRAAQGGETNITAFVTLKPPELDVREYEVGTEMREGALTVQLRPGIIEQERGAWRQLQAAAKATKAAAVAEQRDERRLEREQQRIKRRRERDEARQKEGEERKRRHQMQHLLATLNNRKTSDDDEEEEEGSDKDEEQEVEDDADELLLAAGLGKLIDAASDDEPNEFQAHAWYHAQNTLSYEVVYAERLTHVVRTCQVERAPLPPGLAGDSDDPRDHPKHFVLPQVGRGAFRFIPRLSQGDGSFGRRGQNLDIIVKNVEISQIENTMGGRGLRVQLNPNDLKTNATAEAVAGRVPVVSGAGMLTATYLPFEEEDEFTRKKHAARATLPVPPDTVETGFIDLGPLLPGQYDILITLCIAGYIVAQEGSAARAATSMEQQQQQQNHDDEDEEGNKLADSPAATSSALPFCLPLCKEYDQDPLRGTVLRHFELVPIMVCEHFVMLTVMATRELPIDPLAIAANAAASAAAGGGASGKGGITRASLAAAAAAAAAQPGGDSSAASSPASAADFQQQQQQQLSNYNGIAGFLECFGVTDAEPLLSNRGVCPPAVWEYVAAAARNSNSAARSFDTMTPTQRRRLGFLRRIYHNWVTAVSMAANAAGGGGTGLNEDDIEAVAQFEAQQSRFFAGPQHSHGNFIDGDEEDDLQRTTEQRLQYTDLARQDCFEIEVQVVPHAVAQRAASRAEEKRLKLKEAKEERDKKKKQREAEEAAEQQQQQQQQRGSGRRRSTVTLLLEETKDQLLDEQGDDICDDDDDEEVKNSTQTLVWGKSRSNKRPCELLAIPLTPNTLYDFRFRVRPMDQRQAWTRWSQTETFGTASPWKLECTAVTEQSATVQWRHVEREELMMQATASGSGGLGATTSALVAPVKRDDSASLASSTRAAPPPAVRPIVLKWTAGRVDMVKALLAAKMDVHEAELSRVTDEEAGDLYSIALSDVVMEVEVNLVLSGGSVVVPSTFVIPGSVTNVIIRGLEPGCDYSCRIRQTLPDSAVSNAATLGTDAGWSQNLNIHTLHNIRAVVEGYGAHHCSVHIKQQERKLYVPDFRIVKNAPKNVLDSVQAARNAFASGEVLENSKKHQDRGMLSGYETAIHTVRFEKFSGSGEFGGRRGSNALGSPESSMNNASGFFGGGNDDTKSVTSESGVSSLSGGAAKQHHVLRTIEDVRDLAIPPEHRAISKKMATWSTRGDGSTAHARFDKLGAGVCYQVLGRTVLRNGEKGQWTRLCVCTTYPLPDVHICHVTQDAAVFVWTVPETSHHINEHSAPPMSIEAVEVKVEGRMLPSVYRSPIESFEHVASELNRTSRSQPFPVARADSVGKSFKADSTSQAAQQQSLVVMRSVVVYDLVPNNVYVARVRFRDHWGEWSNYCKLPIRFRTLPMVRCSALCVGDDFAILATTHDRWYERSNATESVSQDNLLKQHSTAQFDFDDDDDDDEDDNDGASAHGLGGGDQGFGAASSHGAGAGGGGIDEDDIPIIEAVPFLDQREDEIEWTLRVVPSNTIELVASSREHVLRWDANEEHTEVERLSFGSSMVEGLRGHCSYIAICRARYRDANLVPIDCMKRRGFETGADIRARSAVSLLGRAELDRLRRDVSAVLTSVWSDVMTFRTTPPIKLRVVRLTHTSVIVDARRYASGGSTAAAAGRGSKSSKRSGGGGGGGADDVALRTHCGALFVASRCLVHLEGRQKVHELHLPLSSRAGAAILIIGFSTDEGSGASSRCRRLDVSVQCTTQEVSDAIAREAPPAIAQSAFRISLPDDLVLKGRSSFIDDLGCLPRRPSMPMLYESSVPDPRSRRKGNSDHRVARSLLLWWGTPPNNEDMWPGVPVRAGDPEWPDRLQAQQLSCVSMIEDGYAVENDDRDKEIADFIDNEYDLKSVLVIDLVDQQMLDQMARRRSSIAADALGGADAARGKNVIDPSCTRGEIKGVSKKFEVEIAHVDPLLKVRSAFVPLATISGDRPYLRVLLDDGAPRLNHIMFRVRAAIKVRSCGLESELRSFYSAGAAWNQPALPPPVRRLRIVETRGDSAFVLAFDPAPELAQAYNQPRFEISFPGESEHVLSVDHSPVLVSRLRTLKTYTIEVTTVTTFGRSERNPRIKWRSPSNDMRATTANLFPEVTQLPPEAIPTPPPSCSSASSSRASSSTRSSDTENNEGGEFRTRVTKAARPPSAAATSQNRRRPLQRSLSWSVNSTSGGAIASAPTRSHPVAATTTTTTAALVVDSVRATSHAEADHFRWHWPYPQSLNNDAFPPFFGLGATSFHFSRDFDVRHERERRMQCGSDSVHVSTLPPLDFSNRAVGRVFYADTADDPAAQFVVRAEDAAAMMMADGDGGGANAEGRPSSFVDRSADNVLVQGKSQQELEDELGQTRIGIPFSESDAEQAAAAVQQAKRRRSSVGQLQQQQQPIFTVAPPKKPRRPLSATGRGGGAAAPAAASASSSGDVTGVDMAAFSRGLWSRHEEKVKQQKEQRKKEIEEQEQLYLQQQLAAAQRNAHKLLSGGGGGGSSAASESGTASEVDPFANVQTMAFNNSSRSSARNAFGASSSSAPSFDDVDEHDDDDDDECVVAPAPAYNREAVVNSMRRMSMYSRRESQVAMIPQPPSRRESTAK